MDKNRNYQDRVLGILLILLGLGLFIVFTVWMILSKLQNFNLNEEQNNILNKNQYAKHIYYFMKNDQSYCVFIPLIFPIVIIVFYAKWTAFNYFKYSN